MEIVFVLQQSCLAPDFRLRDSLRPRQTASARTFGSEIVFVAWASWAVLRVGNIVNIYQMHKIYVYNAIYICIGKYGNG